jgi:hypothetical protein
MNNFEYADFLRTLCVARFGVFIEDTENNYTVRKARDNEVLKAKEELDKCVFL